MSNDKLAILGGDQVRKEPFPPYPVLGEEEKRAVIEVIESGHLSQFAASMGAHFLGGQRIQKFEEDFSAYHGSKYAITCNSATAGLHMALAAAGVGPGDEVIVPPYTFTATASAVVQHNAIPVFVDVELGTYNIDVKKMRKAVTRKTKAVVIAHTLGNPADLDRILKIVKKNNLWLIEDNCDALGSHLRNGPIRLS